MTVKKELFKNRFMDSRVTGPEMTMKEKILGYLIGPFGMLALRAVVINANGSMNDDMAQGLVDMANGHFFQGLKKMVKKS